MRQSQVRSLTVAAAVCAASVGCDCTPTTTGQFAADEVPQDPAPPPEVPPGARPANADEVDRSYDCFELTGAEDLPRWKALHESLPLAAPPADIEAWVPLALGPPPTAADGYRYFLWRSDDGCVWLTLQGGIGGTTTWYGPTTPQHAFDALAIGSDALPDLPQDQTDAPWPMKPKSFAAESSQR